MKVRVDILNHEFISPIKTEDRQYTTMNRRFQDRFRSNNTYKGRPRYGQDYRGRSRYNSNDRGGYGHNMRGKSEMGRQNNGNRRGNLETKIMTEIGVGHMRDKIETEEMVEALVTVN